MGVEEWFFPLAAVALLGIAKGGFGGVGAPVALPVMSLGMPVEQAVGTLLPVLLTMDVVNVLNARNQADYKTIALALPGAFLGVLAGAYFIFAIPSSWVAAGVGVIAIAFAIMALRPTKSDPKGLPRWLALPFGAASGFTSSLAHAGGPPIHIYLLSRGYDQLRFVATSNVFMASVNLLKVAPFLFVGTLNTSTFSYAMWLIPFAIVAALSGFVVARVLPRPWFKYAINTLMIVAGLKLISGVLV